MAQATFVTAKVIPLSRPDQRLIRAQEVDRLLAAVQRHIQTIADRVEQLAIGGDEEGELPPHEELRLWAVGIGQVRGGILRKVESES